MKSWASSYGVLQTTCFQQIYNAEREILIVLPVKFELQIISIIIVIFEHVKEGGTSPHQSVPLKG